MSKKEEYYVYVYIDPRNFQEFYYGKGKGNRKEAHLNAGGDNEKAKRIREIKKAGLIPIIKVIAKDLSEDQAYLIEKTLIWKLGRTLTNKSTGHFSKKFRPHNTLHMSLAHFDFENGLYYVNVGEGPERNWDDCRRFGFLSAGQLPKYSDPLRTLEIGDIVVAYLKTKGFVGIGRVLDNAVRVDDFRYKKKHLSNYELVQKGIFNNGENENSEYLVKVNWVASVERNQAKWKKKSGLYSSQLIKASLSNQAKTIDFLEREFGVDFKELMLESS